MSRIQRSYHKIDAPDAPIPEDMKKEVDFQWLEASFMDRALGAREREALSCLQIRIYSKGDHIIEQGQVGSTLYILYHGFASVEDNNDGDRVRLASMKPGAVFGEVTFMNEGKTIAEVIARGNCLVYTLSRDDFRNLMRDNDELAFTIFSGILDKQADKIRKMNTQLVPILRTIKRKAAQLPLVIKVVPLLFAALYFGSLIYLSFFKYE
ncbi:MAG: cyclic nucleotide-binding domain-containing protein [Mariprofundales bacterium]